MLNDRDSDDKDMLDLDDSDSDEEATESNQHHPLLSELLHDDSDRDLEPRTGTSHDTDDAVAETATSAAVPSTGRQPTQVIRGRVGGRGARWRGQTPVEGGVAWFHCC